MPELPSRHPGRGDRANPHRGDCTGTLCPSCGCCMHCPDDCSACKGCDDRLCVCEAFRPVEQSLDAPLPSGFGMTDETGAPIVGWRPPETGLCAEPPPSDKPDPANRQRQSSPSSPKPSDV